MKNKLIIFTATILFSIILCGAASAALQYEVLDIPPDEPLESTTDPVITDENTETSEKSNDENTATTPPTEESESPASIYNRNDNKASPIPDPDSLSKVITLPAVSATATANNNRRNDTPLILVVLALLVVMAYYMNWKKPALQFLRV